MKALVTGACGFVGGHLVRHLLGAGDEVVGTLLPGLPRREHPCAVRELDITDPRACGALLAAEQPDVVYHLAGMSFVPEAESDFQRALAVNVGAADNIFRGCAALDRPVTVLLVSSADMYGRISPRDLPLDERSAIRPANNYGLSKAMAELVPLRYLDGGGVKGVIARPFNHIGPGQNDRFVTASFAHQVALIAAGKAPPVLKVGNLEARRDFSDVRDIAAGYRLAATKGAGTYTFCSGRAVSIRAILEQIVSIAGVEVSIEIDPTRLRSADIPEIYGSYAKAERELGWRPTIDLEQSLRDIYAAWRGAV